MTTRYHIVIHGAVQGVGFRPFVYRLANGLRLHGWITNNGQGVLIDIEGEKSGLDEFILRIGREKPPHAMIQSLEYSMLDPIGYDSFEICESETGGELSALVLPDIATCPDCRREIFDPSDRRYRYPFTNCTNCGPRFSIITDLPYDRVNTTMRYFIMCDRCADEYHDPNDRRFHAQPIACPDCGPRLELWDTTGKTISVGEQALEQAASFILRGETLALKGLGGFQLMVDATNDDAVERLRRSKKRDTKPFALLYDSLERVKMDCCVSPFEERLLTSSESPIVLLKRISASQSNSNSIAPSVAPRNPYLGIMLPYTPLHHLFMNEVGLPVVATSGNMSDEPICIDEHEAVRRLGGIAGYFLVHNRPIQRHVDDSIVRIVAGREYMLRRARGYAPLPVSSGDKIRPGIFAVGAHLKNTVALGTGNNIFVSQHIGDLETPEAIGAFDNVGRDLQSIYRSTPGIIACDIHPDYHSTRFAQSVNSHIKPIQHHYAHIASCMAENQLEGNLLGIAWDGTGLGLDGTIWGGEFLTINDRSFNRFATFRNFKLPGGEKAIRESKRSAMGVLWEMFGEKIKDHVHLAPLKYFSRNEYQVLIGMMKSNINSPQTSSVGRLFDAVASILDICQRSGFEGQAAMELEFLIGDGRTDEEYKLSYTHPSSSDKPIIVDWETCMLEILNDLHENIPHGMISSKFHNTLIRSILDIAQMVGVERVALSGGCFQNVYLLDRAIRLLAQNGFKPYWHQRIPPNDGGISLGQIYAVLRANKKRLDSLRNEILHGSPLESEHSSFDEEKV